MVNSQYQRGNYEYELVTVPNHLRVELEARLAEGEQLIATATDDAITPHHISWIQSFESIVQELDPLGEIDTWSSAHSDSLITKWHKAQHGGSYSSYDIKTRKISESYLDAKRFHAYLAVLLEIKRGKVRVVKSKTLAPIDSKDNQQMPENSINDAASVPTVFIVHGHDETTLAKIARLLDQLGLKSIILNEQSNRGDTIIEKLERHTSTHYAVVLYTDCDIGASKVEPVPLRSRARQNVVFEHGYLVSKLGRKKVCALAKSSVEVPSDLNGVGYITLDESGSWRFALAKELKGSGLPVDLNRL